MLPVYRHSFRKRLRSLPYSGWYPLKLTGMMQKTLRVLKPSRHFPLSMFLLPAVLFAVFTFYDHHTGYLGFKPAEKPQMYILAVLGILLALPLVVWLGKLNEQ